MTALDARVKDMCLSLDISYREVTDLRIRGKFAKLRSLLAYRLRTETDASWPEIARALGYASHPAAIYAARRYQGADQRTPV